jgi:hypothetical protein
LKGLPLAVEEHMELPDQATAIIGNTMTLPSGALDTKKWEPFEV